MGAQTIASDAFWPRKSAICLSQMTSCPVPRLPRRSYPPSSRSLERTPNGQPFPSPRGCEAEKVFHSVMRALEEEGKDAESWHLLQLGRAMSEVQNMRRANEAMQEARAREEAARREVKVRVTALQEAVKYSLRDLEDVSRKVEQDLEMQCEDPRWEVTCLQCDMEGCSHLGKMNVCQWQRLSPGSRMSRTSSRRNIHAS